MQDLTTKLAKRRGLCSGPAEGVVTGKRSRNKKADRLVKLSGPREEDIARKLQQDIVTVCSRTGDCCLKFLDLLPQFFPSLFVLLLS